MAGKEMFWRRGEGARVEAVGARGEGSERRWGEGGPQKGLRVRDGGEGEKVRCTYLDEDRVPNNRGTFFFFFHNLNNLSTIHSSSPAMHRLPVYAAISMHKNTLRCHVSRASCIEPRAASDEICHLPLVKLYMRHTTRFSKDLQKKTGS